MLALQIAEHMYADIIFPKINSKRHLNIDGFWRLQYVFFFSGKHVKLLRFLTVKLGMLLPLK